MSGPISFQLIQLRMVAGLFRTRWRAVATSLAGSLAVAVACLVVLRGFWYPLGLFAPLGGLQLLALICAIDVVVGPVLIAIVYKPGKKGLLLDVVVIIARRVAALLYGLHVQSASRPAYIVFVKDRFEIVRANEMPEEELARAGRYRDKPLDGPRIVGARVPADPGE